LAVSHFYENNIYCCICIKYYYLNNSIRKIQTYVASFQIKFMLNVVFVVFVVFSCSLCFLLCLTYLQTRLWRINLQPFRFFEYVFLLYIRHEITTFVFMLHVCKIKKLNHLQYIRTCYKTTSCDIHLCCFDLSPLDQFINDQRDDGTVCLIGGSDKVINRVSFGEKWTFYLENI